MKSTNGIPLAFTNWTTCFFPSGRLVSPLITIGLCKIFFSEIFKMATVYQEQVVFEPIVLLKSELEG